VIITYTDKQFTLNVTDEQGDTILEMSAADVQFKMDLAHGRPPRRITRSRRQMSSAHPRYDRCGLKGSGKAGRTGGGTPGRP